MTLSQAVDVTIPDLEEWLVRTCDDSPDCDGLDEDGCGLEAVARAIWDGGCEHVAQESLLCADHRDELEADVKAGRIMACATCRKYLRVVRIEPLR